MASNYLDDTGLAYFWSKIKGWVNSSNANVVHRTGDETLEGIKIFQNTAEGHYAGETVTDLIIRNPEVDRGTPVEAGRSYTRVILADAEGDTEETFAGRLGLLEVVSPKENDTAGEELRLGCYKYSDNSADYAKYAGFRAGYDLDGIPFSTAPATSDERTDSTDIVTRGYMEASEWNWQKTKNAALVQFKSAPESDLEPVVDFMFTETPPASGDKSPSNPSTITGAAAVEIGRCGKNLLVYPYIVNSSTFPGGLTATASSDGSVKYNGTGSDSIQFFSVTDGNFYAGSTPCKIELAPGVQYTFSLKLVSGNVSDLSDIVLAIIDHDAGVAIGTCAIGASVTFTAANRHFRARLEARPNVSFSNVVVAPQLEFGSVATPFEPYSGDEYTIQFGNTYYGGSLDVATGVMTVNYQGLVFDGTEAWEFKEQVGSSEYYRYSLTNISAALNTVDQVCSHFNFLYNWNNASEHFYVAPSSPTFITIFSKISTLTNFKAWLANQYSTGTPVTVCYKIASQTVQLTPTQIRSLPALDKYEPRINMVYTDQEAVQVGYQRYVNTQEQISRVCVHNTNNYPFHRIAYIAVSESYKTYSLTLFINAPFVSSGYGIARVSLRTYASPTASVCSVYWLARTRDLPVDILQVGFRNTNGNSYVDVFIHTSGEYNSYVCRVIDNSDANNYGYFFNVIPLSNEDYSTTVSDRRKSIESYASVTSAGTEIHNNTYTNTIYASDRGAFVDLTTNQDIDGTKYFTVGPAAKSTSFDVTNDSTTQDFWRSFWFCDKNNQDMVVQSVHYATNRAFSIRMYDKSGSQYWMMFWVLGHDGSGRYVSCGGDFRPTSPNNYTLGNASYKWKEIWCTQSSINSSSDERIKSNIKSIPDNVLDVWENVNWIEFQYNDAISEKGENARLHTGLIAQRVASIFKQADVQVDRYGFYLYDKWDSEEASFDENGNEIKPAMEAGDAYGIRYTEALCMEAAYQRRENARLKKRIADLEERLETLELRLKS